MLVPDKHMNTARVEVFMATEIQVEVFCVVTPWSDAVGYPG